MKRTGSSRVGIAKELYVRAESEMGEWTCEDFWLRLLAFRRISVWDKAKS